MVTQRIASSESTCTLLPVVNGKKLPHLHGGISYVDCPCIHWEAGHPEAITVGVAHMVYLHSLPPAMRELPFVALP